MPSSKVASLRPAVYAVINTLRSSPLIVRRYARRAVVERIFSAQAFSAAAFDGLQTKMRRRLGVSPAPVASYGPVIMTPRSTALAGRLTVGLLNGRRLASASSVGDLTNAAATSCGPAFTGSRT